MKSHVFGMWPIATKAPSTASSVTFSGLVTSSSTAVVSMPPSFPLNSLTVVFHTIVIFGLLSTAFCDPSDARNESFRWTSVTWLEVRESTSASSIAVSPPPTTITGFPE